MCFLLLALCVFKGLSDADNKPIYQDSKDRIFIINLIKVSFWLGSDSANNKVNAASPVLLMTISPLSLSSRLLRCRKSTNKKAPLHLALQDYQANLHHSAVTIRMSVYND